MNTEKKRQSGMIRIASVAMFGALAYACMLFIKIPVQFLTLDVKDSLIVLCGLIFGPISALALSIIVPLFELVTVSGTGIYGFVMNFLSSAVFSVTASLIYKYKKTFFGAIMGLVCAVLAMTAVMMLANLLITPYYMGVNTETVVALIPKLLLPFNFIKAVLNAAIVLLLYKPLSNILKKTGIIMPSDKAEDGEKKKVSPVRNIIVAFVALAVIAISLSIIFFVLGK